MKLVPGCKVKYPSDEFIHLEANTEYLSMYLRNLFWVAITFSSICSFANFMYNFAMFLQMGKMWVWLLLNVSYI